MAKKHMKRCSASLLQKCKSKLQWSIMLRLRIAIHAKSTSNKCWRMYGEKATLPHWWWYCKSEQLLWRTVWGSLKKLRLELSHDPAVPLLSIQLEITIIWKYTCTPSSLQQYLQIARTWKQAKCPSTEE